MKRFVSTLMLLSMVALLPSCNKFLDIKPKGFVIPEYTQDYEKLLNYAQLMKYSDNTVIYMTDDLFIPDDEQDFTGGVPGLDVAERNFYLFNETIYGDGIKDPLYEYSYNRIYYYNVIVDDIMGTYGGSEQKKKELRAEALVGRALEYLNLVNAYAKHYDPKTAATDPGVPLMIDKKIEKTDLTRASVQEVYDQIKRDLDEAAPNLPEKPVNNAYRASRPVGYGMLARMYLYMGDYEKALQNAKTSLEHNSTLLDLKKYAVVNPMGYIGRINVPDGAKNPENTYVRLAPYTFGFSTRGYGSDDLLALFDKEKDQRYLLYFTKKLGSYEFKRPLWAPYIYANLAMATPEMYLIAAESEARLGNTAEALRYLNTLRDNRIIDNKPLQAASAKEALRMVLEERRRELPFLGTTRLIDLKRLNREPEFAKTVVHTAGGKEYQLEPNSPRYVLPIPLNVLRHNPNMKPNIR